MARPRPRKNFVEEWRSLWKPDLEAIAYNGKTCNPTRVDRKVLRWAKQNCSHKPHFIKIINYDAAPDHHRTPSHCKLRFPIPFAEQHFRKLERVVKLENEDGKTWKVAFRDLRWHPTWQQGWFRFASDNNLKPGDVIVFMLVGNSRFRFSHFDERGNKSSTDRAGAAARKECESAPLSVSRTLARPRPRKNFVEEWRSLWKPDLEAIAYNGRTCDPTRVDPKVLQWAKQNCSHRKPHFIKIVNKNATPDQHRRCKLRFPTPFAEQHFRKLDSRVVKLENEDHGKTWKVAFNDLRWHPTWQQGWFRFATDNNLKPGDVIVFVLVANSHFRFSHFDEHGNKSSTDRAKKECASLALKERIGDVKSTGVTSEVMAQKLKKTRYSSLDAIVARYSQECDIKCSIFQSHEDSDEDAECVSEEHVKAGDSKRAPSLFSKNDGIRDITHDKVLIVDLGPVPSSKRRKLCKLGEMVMNNDTL